MPKIQELWYSRAGEGRLLVSRRERESNHLQGGFCSGSQKAVKAIKRLDDACFHWWEQIILPSQLIQMLISSENTLTDTPINVLPAIWTSLSLSKVTHKINHHGTGIAELNG